MKRPILSLLCVLILLSGILMPAAAVEIVDTTRKGSLSISMTFEGSPVKGGKLTIYRVAEIAVDDWNYSFRYLSDYADCEVPLDDLTDPELPAALAQLVKTKKLKGTVKTIDKNGQATFPDLELGLYLVVQTKAASGFRAAKPFLVSVPGHKDGAYIYDVDASPKVELERAPTVTTRPSGNLPQTGQLSWPIPVLLVSGLLLIVGGWYLFLTGKRKKHET